MGEYAAILHWRVYNAAGYILPEESQQNPLNCLHITHLKMNSAILKPCQPFLIKYLCFSYKMKKAGYGEQLIMDYIKCLFHKIHILICVRSHTQFSFVGRNQPQVVQSVLICYISIVNNTLLRYNRQIQWWSRRNSIWCTYFLWTGISEVFPYV